MDWLCLVGGAFLCASPVLQFTGILTRPAQIALLMFPWGILLIGLVLVVVQGLLPGVRLDFGLSGTRWASIAIMLTACGFAAYTLVWFAVQVVGKSSTDSPKLLSVFILVPPVLLLGALIFGVMRLFLGQPLGPKGRNR